MKLKNLGSRYWEGLDVEILKALRTMLTRALFRIDFSKSIDKILHICFSFGFVKFETSLKVSLGVLNSPRP